MQGKRIFTTHSMAACAMLAALSVVFARLLIPMPAADTRYSIEAVPTVIAGILFGPIPGAVVGFSYDFVGGFLFSPYGYNPVFAVPPILYGLLAGLLRTWIKNEEVPRFWKLLVIISVPALFGSVIWQSFWLAKFYGITSGKGALAYMAVRLPQFAITAVVDALLIWLLFRSGVFRRLKYWPIQTDKNDQLKRG